MAKAMLGVGSFWSVEAAFRRIPGVRNTIVGFSGGQKPSPTYEEVLSGSTGHAEVVVVDYDPRRVSYRRLLDVFWMLHDPTGRDHRRVELGPHRRSVVFYFNDAQRRAALALRRRLEVADAHLGSITTEILAAKPFYPAEEHHQRYLEKRGLMAKSLFDG